MLTQIKGLHHVTSMAADAMVFEAEAAIATGEAPIDALAA